jgi:hypothetical protein
LSYRVVVRRTSDARAGLEWLEANATLIATRANNDCDDALSSSMIVGGRSRGDSSHPELHAARRLAGPDPVADAMVQLMTALDDVLDGVWRARHAASKLITDPTNHDGVRALALAKDKAGAGYCRTCNAYAVGIKDDRLRGGECYACYRYRRDHHGNPRPAELWNGQQHR